ncbi:SGNH/GDSL hydrolase family protein [Nocardioides sp. Kera G14]|uniref:SGNH/GDSL hydrolase family protein n=1 Tax=Nocardioides sp. Kera G14 TaxID=2884264 RepID=UPI001D10074E|nr:SGNH/GDSL hydrolase family protein [Nocardioides sp. Kera G14]UDY24144.1 SGNH/GDSL hydrolase family protein [Nocardioides sp. Kera G14]
MRARPRLLSLTLAIALVVALAGVMVVRDRAGAASVAKACRLFQTQHVRRLADVSGKGRAITVIGDSWSAGHKLRNLDASWPSRLPGRVTVDGFSGSGFSLRASECGVSRAFSNRTSNARGASLVIVEGGLNDYDQSRSAVRTGFRRLIGRLVVDVPLDDILIVGPAPAPLRLKGARRVDGWLSALSSDAGVRYLSAIHQKLPYLPDRLHLTPAGHRQFGDWVASHLTSA